MFIHEAAYKALRELGAPTHVSDLYRAIVAKGYYEFGAKEPENALAIQLSRKSNNVDIGNSSPEKFFYRAAPATYGLIEWLEVNGVLSAGDDVPADVVEEDVLSILRDEDTQTTKEQLVLARIGQGRFRVGVLELWNHRCAVTGTSVAVRASHIKPWRDCDSHQRLDPANGLPLVATLDALFDAHLISFTIDGQILISSELSDHEQKCLGVSNDMRLRHVPSAENERYLQVHRKQLKP